MNTSRTALHQRSVAAAHAPIVRVTAQRCLAMREFFRASAAYLGTTSANQEHRLAALLPCA